MTSYQDALVSFALLLRFDKKCFTRLCFKNLFLRLSVCLCVFCAIGCQYSTLNSPFGCFPGMMSSLAKSKQIIGAQFQALFSAVFLLFDVPQYSNRLKTHDQQFTLRTKNHCISSLRSLATLDHSFRYHSQRHNH